MLRELVLQLDAISTEDIPEHEMDVKDNETVVGTLDGDLLKLWGLRNQTRNEMCKAARKALSFLIDGLTSGSPSGGPNKDQLSMLHKEGVLIGNRFAVINQLFWWSLRVAFPEIVTKPDIAIRKGFKVVYSDAGDEAATLQTMFLSTLAR